MPNTIDDFLKLFGGDSAVDEQQAAQYHERFVSTKPEDNHFDNSAYHEAVAEHLETLPDDQFHEAAKNAIAQAPPQERQDLLGTLMGALGGAGGLGGMIGGLGGGGASGGGTGLAGIAKMLEPSIWVTRGSLPRIARTMQDYGDGSRANPPSSISPTIWRFRRHAS